MNQLSVGKKVFSIHHNDGKENPEYYWLYFEGVVEDVSIGKNNYVAWKSMLITSGLEKRFLSPNIDGFCYYMAELPDMEQYKDGDLYKIPTNILLQHMKSYKSPWGNM